MSQTFTTLVSLVTAYLDRTDAATLDRIPDFISQAEERIAREANTLGLETYVVSNFVPSVSVYQKPARWKRTLNINFGTGTLFGTRNRLKLRKYDYLREYWPDPGVTGTPRFYSDYDFSNFLIAPTPAGNNPFEVCYMQLPEPISATNETNWITNYAPDVLLYATLLEAAPYILNDERIPIWKEYYDRALASLNAEDEQRLVDRTTNVRAD